MNSGTKTAGAVARTALDLAGRFTGEAFFAKSSLVKAQAFPKHESRSASEPVKTAVPPTLRHIESLESAILTGTTAQERVMAGFFIFLVHSSHRCANGQSTRRLQLTDEA